MSATPVDLINLGLVVVPTAFDKAAGVPADAVGLTLEQAEARTASGMANNYNAIIGSGQAGHRSAPAYDVETDGPIGEACLLEACGGVIPPGPWMQTASGSIHRLFAIPAELPAGRQLKFGQVGLLPKVDAPWQFLALEGDQRVWHALDRPLPLIPAELLELLLTSEPVERAPYRGEACDAWGSAALADEAEKLAAMGEKDNRGLGLYSAANRMASRRRHVDLGEAQDVLMAAAATNGSVAKYGEDKMRRQFDNGIRDGLARPENGPAGPELGTFDGSEYRPCLSGFIGLDGLRALEPPTWLIEPYVAKGALIMLAAAANTGKTFVAVDWALQLSSQGHKVLYAALEGLHGLQARVAAWEEHHGKRGGGISFTPAGYSLNLLDKDSVGEFCRQVEEAGGFDLIVLDNLGEALPGDENDSEVVAKAMDALKRVRRAGGNAVLDLHNFGHGGTRARGHSKLLDAHDTVIYLNPVTDSVDGRRISCGKERNAERFPDHYVKLNAVADSLVVVPGPGSLSGGLVFDAVKAGHDTVTKLERHLTGQLGRRQIERHLKRLVELDDVTVDATGKTHTYRVKWSQVAV